MGTSYSESIVAHLVRLGIDLNAADSGSWPALYIAVLHSNESMVRTLLGHGPRITVSDSGYLGNAVHLAIDAARSNSGPLQIPREVDITILRMLLGNGVLQTMNDAACVNRDGLTWLNHAVRSCPRNNTAVVQPFLVPGLSLDVPDTNDNRTPLHMAVCHNRVDLVTALLDLGADHRTVDWQGKSPFATACNRPNCVLIDLLLRRDVTLFDQVVGERGETAEMCMQSSLEQWVTCGGRFGGEQKKYYEQELDRRRLVVRKFGKLAEARVDAGMSESELQVYYNFL